MDLKYADIFYGNGATDRFIKEGVASKWFYIKALCGNTVPHAVLPFGRISVGAYSGGYPTGYGTHYPNSCGGIKKLDEIHKIRGFSHLHQSGTGAMQFYYNYAIVTPFYGDSENIYNYYPLEKEGGMPGYYEAEFNNVLCKFTVNENTAIHSYKFKKEGGRLAVDFSNDGLHELFGPSYSGKVEMINLTADSENTACFEGVFSGIKLYFAVQVKNAEVTLAKDKMCAFFDFEGDDAELKLSYSTLSVNEAKGNIAKTDKSFDELCDNASLIWKEHLSAIEVETDDEELKEKFYSNFYHTIVKPVDMTGENILGVKGDVVSDLATFWDQYKTQLPLVMLLYPEMGRKVADCIVNISRTLKKISCSFGTSKIFPCEQQGKMFGIFILLDAYFSGLIGKDVIEECVIREFEREDYDEFKKSGTFQRYTHILDVTDICFDVAAVTDNKELKDRLLTYAENWKKAYDSDGLMSVKSPYYEGDRYTYSFRLQSNMKDRIELAGGKERFTELLDDFFGFSGESVEQITELDAYKLIESKQYHRFEGFNNECDMETPYAYIFADRHDRLCEIVHACVKESFGTGINGLPGNNDSGGLSSCFMWNALGIFPYSGKGEFLLGSPHFKNAKIKLPQGKTLEIVANNLSDGRFYVDKITFNGIEIKDYRIKTEKLLEGGTLEFFMK